MRTDFQTARKLCALMMLLTFASIDCAANEAKSIFEPVHWAYSSFFGTGWYQIEDARSVFVVRVPIRQTLRKSSLTESGSRRLGVENRYPVAVGLHDIEDLGGIIENDNFATGSFTPGVELEIPINPRWYLRTL